VGRTLAGDLNELRGSGGRACFQPIELRASAAAMTATNVPPKKQKPAPSTILTRCSVLEIAFVMECIQYGWMDGWIQG
jgi:hypothetical protein